MSCRARCEFLVALRAVFHECLVARARMSCRAGGVEVVGVVGVRGRALVPCRTTTRGARRRRRGCGEREGDPRGPGGAPLTEWESFRRPRRVRLHCRCRRTRRGRRRSAPAILLFSERTLPMTRTSSRIRVGTYPVAEVKKLPYLASLPSDRRRIVPVLPFFEVTTGEWHTYIQHGDNQLIRMADGELISGSYLARSPADPTCDFELELGTVIMRNFSHPEILQPFQHLENDVHRFASILYKYKLFWEHRHAAPSAPDLVESELEYLVFVIRSFYDLLQNIIHHAYQPITAGASPSPHKRQLPHSFRKVIIKDDRVLTKDQLMLEYGMLPKLAEWYEHQAVFFSPLRNLRDNIAHDGARPSTILAVESGFAVIPTDPPWNQFDLWPGEQLWNGRLGSLRMLFAVFISHAIDAATSLSLVLRDLPDLQHDVTIGRFYVRSSSGSELVGLPSLIAHPWETAHPSG